MDTTGELFKQYGVFAVMLLITLLSFRKLLDNQSEVIRANSRAQEASAASLKAVLDFLSSYTGHIATLQNAFEAHTQSATDASKDNISALKAHTTALNEVTAKLTGVQDTIHTELLGAKDEMRGAGQQITVDVNKHTDEAHALTGEAISAARDENRETHAGQAKDLTKIMSDVSRDVKENGDATRGKVDGISKQLEAIQKTLDAMSTDITGLKELRSEVTALTASVDELKKDLVPPPPPSVDPLAAPGKAEEMK